MRLLDKLHSLFSNKLGSDSFTYGILSYCGRCKFRGKYETIAIISLSKGNKVILIQNYKGKDYIRKGKCIGFRECGNCYKSIDNDGKDYSCSWFKVK